MKSITIKCYFTDSENWISKILIEHGWDRIGAYKKINPHAQHHVFISDRYVLTGREELIDELLDFLEESDFDIEIES